MVQKEYDLGAAELEVLKALWDAGPATVRDVMNRLHESGRQPAYTTVQTVLTRLEHKGFVGSDKTGPAYVYEALVSRDHLSRSRLKTLLEQLYDGAAGPLVLQLVKSQRLTPEEISELHKLIDGLDRAER